MSPDAHPTPNEQVAGMCDGADRFSEGESVSCRGDQSQFIARKAEHPLGPCIMVVPLEANVVGRFYAAIVALGAIVVLAVAARLTPDPHGSGTHQQLGLPPCGFMVMSGLPCPTCGMTTAFALTVRGRVISALWAQAGGFLLAVATILAALLAIFAAATGRKIVLNWYRISPTRTIWIGTALFLLAWGGKILLGLATRTLPVR